MQTINKIGIVVAIEIDAVLKRYGEPKEVIQQAGHTVHVYTHGAKQLYVISSGAGEIAATMATQYLITRFDVQLIVNFGVVGALTAQMTTADLCVVDKVVHYEFETTDWLNLPKGQHPEYDAPLVATTPHMTALAREVAPMLRPVVCASGDKFVSEPEAKAQLHQLFGADICEMEAAGVVFTCHQNYVDCLCIKAVSDSLVGGGKEFFTELERVSTMCFDVVDQVLAKLG